MENYIKPSQEELKNKLTELQYKVTQEAATESAYTGEYDKFYEKGRYTCIVCDLILFYSETKFDSGCGWPAFNQGLAENIEERVDTRGKIEVVCKRCKAHLGHKFKHGPKSITGIRYCINSASIKFQNQ